MAINFLNSIDLNQLELLNAAIENQATDALAGTGVDGQLYYNTTDDDLKVWTGSAWSTIVTTGSGDAVESITAGDGIAVTGTAAVPIVSVDYSSGSDNLIFSAPIFSGVVPESAYSPFILLANDNPGVSNDIVERIRIQNLPLDRFGAPIDNVPFNSKKITGLADPTNAQDAATKSYVDAATVGGLIYQGGYNASTNSPALDTAVGISSVGTGSGPFIGTVATSTGGSGTGMTVYVETNAAGALLVARVVNSGSGYAVGDTVVPTITGHSGQTLAVSSIPDDDIEVGFTYTVTTGGYFYNELVAPGDVLIAEVDDPSEQDSWTTVQNNIDLASEVQVGIGNVVEGTSGTITAPYSNGTATLDVVDSTASQKGAVIVAPGGAIDVSYSSGTATVSVEDSTASNKGAVIVAGGDGISVSYSGGTATVDLDKISFNNTGPAAAGTTYTIDAATHGLGTDSSIIMVQLVEVSSGETVFTDVTRGANGLITITFAETQTADSYRALLQKIV